MSVQFALCNNFAHFFYSLFKKREKPVFRKNKNGISNLASSKMTKVVHISSWKNSEKEPDAKLICFLTILKFRIQSTLDIRWCFFREKFEPVDSKTNILNVV